MTISKICILLSILHFLCMYKINTNSLFQFFDGPGRMATVTRRYCTGVDYPPLISSGSEAFLRYMAFDADIDVDFEIKISSTTCNLAN